MKPEILSIDLNSDVGESFGAYQIGNDNALMPLLTSANIACGFHAGDPQVMARTVQLALQHNVAIGAHPGFADLAGFGRRALDATPAEIENDVLYQIGALAGIAHAHGGKLAHVKAHGALYNLAATKPDIARAIARGIARFDSNLVMLALAGSAMVAAARAEGLRIAREGFCDRAYNRDGTLRSRREAGAVIHDAQRAAEQALQIVREKTVTTPEGETLALEADTLCIHGDTPGAVEIARAVRGTLQKNGIAVTRIERGSRGAGEQR